ncbi:hypothetical protein [Rheinheimera maricola]|uniref:Uncharacterized protein n=1 Tax=Rheinheimera maricola TaxID=2793282 RepID=A0ABS7X6X4_9GAMM|nr:hypothetical protein [Rheinheimera maricola]MBZ9611306.1 hypothetical protein [Rheinheimera maricola]
MTLPRHLALVLCCTTLPYLSGCTVLGMVADNAIFEEEERHRPIMEQGHPNTDQVLFGQLGLEADIAIVKKVIAVVQNKPEPAAKRCIYENGIRICFEQGAEGY